MLNIYWTTITYCEHIRSARATWTDKLGMIDYVLFLKCYTSNWPNTSGDFAPVQCSMGYWSDCTFRETDK